MKKWRIMLLCTLLLGAILAIVGCGKTSKGKAIDLNQYVKASFEKYDGMGTAKVSFDEESFSKAMLGKAKFIAKGEDAQLIKLLYSGTDDEVAVGILLNCIEVNAKKTENLHNGDEIIIQIKIDDDYKKYVSANITWSDINVKVAGLEAVEQFDPFKYMTVEFNGVSPNGTATVNVDYDQKEMQYVSFSVENDGRLKNDEDVIIKASLTGSVDAFVERFGSVLSETEKTMKVSGLSKYINDVSDVPSETYDKMNKQFEDNFRAHAAQHWGKEEKIVDFQFAGNYLLNLKEGVATNPHNYMYFVYKVTYTHTKKLDHNFEYYWYGYYTDVTLDSDGKCNIDLNNYKVSEASSSWGWHDGDYLQVEDISNYVAGFADLDSFVNAKVISMIDKYEYTATMK